MVGGARSDEMAPNDKFRDNQEGEEFEAQGSRAIQREPESDCDTGIRGTKSPMDYAARM